MAASCCVAAMEQVMASRLVRLTLRRPGGLVNHRIGISKRSLVSQAVKQQATPQWLKQYKANQASKAPEGRRAVLLEKPGPADREEVPVEKAEKKIPRQAAAPRKKSVKEVRQTTKFDPFADSGFSSLSLSEALLKRLHTEGFRSPTGIQASAIPLLLEGHDAALQSYTGSGKTLAYLLPILSKVGPLREGAGSEEFKGGGVEAVIVTPSRELGMQIVREAEKLLAAEHRKLIQQLIGGANIKRQEEGLKKNKPFMVVGTPGRISELSRAGKLHTHGCRFLVLDESDQLLSMKYRTDMKRILEHVGLRKSSPGEERKGDGSRIERQTILVSATMPPAVLKAAEEWGRTPLLIKPVSKEAPAEAEVQAKEETGEPEVRNEKAVPESVDVRGARESLPPNLAHYYVVSPVRHRVDTLRRCIHALDAKTVLVFMNFTHRLKDTVFKLQARKTDAACLHGEQGKLERMNVLSAFRNQKLRVLVVSEVGARGLDVPECDLVVNLELPTDGTHYAHRAGRTGRLGRQGTVISVCEQPDEFVIRKFERQLGISISRCEVSHGIFSLFGEQESEQEAANLEPESKQEAANLEPESEQEAANFRRSNLT